jgi:adenylate kinase
MIITITGTPGVGKTYLAKKLAKNTGARYFDLNAFIKKNKLYDAYDKKDKTYDVDVKKLKKSMKEILKKYVEKMTLNAKTMNTLSPFIKKYGNTVLIDSHLSHYIPSNMCIVVKSDIKNISQRLKKRKYSKKKIDDNIQSEIFDICLEEAKGLNDNVIVVNN